MFYCISPVVHAGQTADGLLHAELDGPHELRRLELLVGHLAIATHATVAQLPLLLTLTLPLLMRLKKKPREKLATLYSENRFLGPH